MSERGAPGLGTNATHHVRRVEGAVARAARAEHVRGHRRAVRHRAAPPRGDPAQRLLCVRVLALRMQLGGGGAQHTRAHDGLEPVGADEKVAMRRGAVREGQLERRVGHGGRRLRKVREPFARVQPHPRRRQVRE